MFKADKLLIALAISTGMASAAPALAAEDVDHYYHAQGTAAPNHFYDEGQYVEHGFKPHKMRDSDPVTVISNTASGLYDQGQYVSTRQGPHRMMPRSTHEVSSTPKPGFFYDQGEYRKMW